MSAWEKRGRHDGRLRFGGLDGAGAAATWRAMRPMALRAAGVLALAGAAVTAIAAAGSDPEPARQAAFVVAKQDQAAQATTTTSVRVVPLAEPTEPPETATGDPASSPPPEPDPPETVLAAPAADIGAVPDAPQSTAVESMPSQPSDLADCPRDWLTAPSGARVAPVDCDAAAQPLETAAAQPVDPVLLEAASRRASELTGAAREERSAPTAAAPEQMPETTAAVSEEEASPFTDAASEEARELTAVSPVPQVPAVRPEAPPVRRQVARNTRKARASRPSGPPPKCGRKYARWRYVDDVPTWYCR